MTLDELEAAFQFVNSATPYEHEVIVSRATGATFYRSESAGIDECPSDADGNEDYVSIPHGSDLGLGRDLALEFVETDCPEHAREAQSFFRRPGAFSPFKDLLEAHGLLERWYAFESGRTREKLLAWCEESGLLLADRP